MSTKLLMAFAGIAALVVLAGTAYAGVPCAGTSDIDATPTCGAVCPAGDMDIIEVCVTIRDCYGTPLENKTVVIDSDTPGYYFCPGYESESCVTDSNGQCCVTFQYLGGCDTPDVCQITFKAVVDGVTIGPSDPIQIGSPDADASGLVDLTDFIYFAGKYFTTDCCADYDCSGLVDLTDFIAFAGHYFHACPP
jgi:hypothetical protein